MFNQLCVWSGTVLGDSTVADFEDFFKQNGFTVKFAEEVVTNPDLDEFGYSIANTGGRHDPLFFLEDSDIAKFTVSPIRFNCGIRWWEDVIFYNEGSYLYSDEVLAKYPIRW